MKKLVFLAIIFAIFLVKPEPAQATYYASLTYLGTIASSGGSVSVNNNNTAVPFTIPIPCPRLLVVVPTESAGFSFSIDQISTLTATSNDFNVVGPASVQFSLTTQNTGAVNYIAVFNSGAGGNVKVYCIAGQAQS